MAACERCIRIASKLCVWSTSLLLHRLQIGAKLEGIVSSLRVDLFTGCAIEKGDQVTAMLGQEITIKKMNRGWYVENTKC